MLHHFNVLGFEYNAEHHGIHVSAVTYNDMSHHSAYHPQVECLGDTKFSDMRKNASVCFFTSALCQIPGFFVFGRNSVPKESLSQY